MTKRIGVISDTHNKLSDSAFELFHGDWDGDRLNRAAQLVMTCAYDDAGKPSLEHATGEGAGRLEPRKVDAILHAGDICRQGILDELEAVAPCVAVLGNNDYDPLFCSDGAVQAFRSLRVEGVEVAMAHIPTDLRRALEGRPPLVPKLVKREPDLAVCGHTHVPDVRVEGKHVLLNPGSASRGRSGSGHNVALVDVSDGRVARIAIVTV